MNNDTTALKECLFDALQEARWVDSYDIAVLLLPIIAAEVRKAQADAWDEGAYAGYDDGKYDGDTPNPYREKED